MKGYLLSTLSLLIASAATATIVTLKPGPEVGQDAAIVLITPTGCIPTGWSTTPQNTPNPSGVELSMHSNTINSIGCNQAFDRSLIRFTEINTNSIIPMGATINYAELRLYTLPTGTPNMGTNAVNVRRLIDSLWNENSVTWDWATTVYGITMGVPTPMSAAALPITSPSIPSSIGPSTPGMVIVDVTNDVKIFHSNPSDNKGWILELQTESPTRWMKFASSDHPNASLWPELYIDYTLTTNAVQTIENTQDVLEIVPNPATDIVSIQLSNPHKDFATVILTDLTGKVVYEAQHLVDASTHNIKFSVAELPAAFYSVQVQNGTRVLHGKMVKQN